MLLLFLGVTGCSRSVGKAEMPGVYEFRIDNIRQQITVRSDGTYANVFYRGNVLVWSDHGAWTYEDHQGNEGILFAKFRFGIPEHSALRGFWFVVPGKTIAGDKELCFDPDLNQCFRQDGK